MIAEIRNRPSRQRADTFLTTGRIAEESADPGLASQVEDAAKRTGDLGVLSDTDIQLLALALGKSLAGDQVVVVSSDLALLNTARELRLDLLDPQKRMKEKILWMRRCPACGYVEHRSTQPEECPTCGTTMRRVPANRKRLNPSQ